MPRRLSDRRWLEQLLDEELLGHDPHQARARLPADVRAAASTPLDLAPAANLLVARSLRRRVAVRVPGEGADRPASARDVFLDEVRAHIGLALDLALLRGDPFVRARRRAEIAAALAAAAGEHALAIEAEPEQPGGASDRAVERAVRGAAEALHARFYPPAEPAHALPLHAGKVAVLRRRLARVVSGYHRDGRLVGAALARHGAYAARETLLLVEALAGLLGAAGDGDGAAVRVLRQRQIARLGLGRADAREARRAIVAPRDPEAIADAAPERVRGFLLEQLRLAQLGLKLVEEEPAAWVERFVRAAGLDAQAIASAEIEAAAQHADHADWLEALGDGPRAWQGLASDLDVATDEVVERVTVAVTDNLEALVTEIRETGELGQLLARAASGGALSRDEKKKVKAQLIDLAKAVPALAIFAAPGGMLLLPLLAKLLPFNLLPSAWEKPAESKRKQVAR
ncbi:LETM1 domain-containing protein [Anaeromyxobacter sp. Fw109-5]|uniref:LETM1 domain-containing protein n=1 Tax=Anaeromyxobacter sp. (strain Fw109-5) TaxID=404589 RepID=UPI00031A4AF6|nr:LETM1 domain-containing protein [Anaeromyxobacter sp. Fw109-5]